MSNARLAVLGVCIALGACGEKFVSNGGSAGSGGTASAGDAGANLGGEFALGGNAGVGGGDAEGGEAGTATGGAPVVAGAGGISGGVGGAGGALVVPALPQLGLLLWLRADVGVKQQNGHVQTWQDQSGNQIDATQTTGSLRPVYLAAGFDGRPTLEFDGQGQFLKFDEGFGDFAKGLTGLIVARPTKSDCASMLEFSNGSEIDDIAFGMWQNKWSYEVETPLIQTGNVDHEAFSLYAANHRPLLASELRINGSALGSLQMPLPKLPESGVRVNNFVGHTLYEGGCEYFKGQISEIILYSRSLTGPEVNTIEKDLDARWGISQQGRPDPMP